MTISGPDADQFKTLLKETLSEVLDQRREWFSALLTEALEDIALVEAIKEGEQTEVVSREDIFALLRA
ncbi:MAG TPA: hypothetical protein VFT66_19225 [Roseiflexaceae bacterium]|nr:hypothetical protein [Roseiflexaceae bacterium]